MAAYRTAARLFPGLHLPLVGMGMEYQRMNNLHLAEQLFEQVGASRTAQAAPFCVAGWQSRSLCRQVACDLQHHPCPLS